MTRGRRAVVALTLFVALLLPQPLLGEPKANAEDLQSQLANLKAQTQKAGAAFDRAYWKLDEAEVRIEQTDKRIGTTTKQLAAARKKLNIHAAAMYRREETGYLSVLLGASSFDNLVIRLDYLKRIGSSDAKAIATVKGLRSKLVEQRAVLVKERTTRKRALSGLRTQRDRLQARLKAKTADFLRVKAQLDAVRGGPNRPSGVASLPGPNGMVFPVHGAYYYANTWGASRGGGRRRHQGTDIMAPTGTPCVAVLSGTIRSKTGGLGGKTIWLTSNNGWQFYYAHLDGWAVRSGRVKAGQIIGYVGSTGNAAGGAPHLHFQIQPHGGPVNPYPYLRQME